MTLAEFGYSVYDLCYSCSQNILFTWLSNLSILSVPDEGYSRNASCALNLISTFLLPDYGVRIFGLFALNNLFAFPIFRFKHTW